jgi:hypothetical protein
LASYKNRTTVPLRLPSSLGRTVNVRARTNVLTSSSGWALRKDGTLSVVIIP